MIFGKHINRYYLRYLPMLLMGIAALLAVDYFQLIIPSLYQMVINGMNTGQVMVNGAAVPFDMDFLMNQICLPMVRVVMILIAGRFTWRICFFGAGVRAEEDLRNRMFSH